MRTEEEIEAGVIPGVDSIVLGGVSYPARTPNTKRARFIRRILAEYERARLEAGDDGPKQIDLLEAMIDTCLPKFSEEIEQDWARIEETVTDSERLTAIQVVGKAVFVAFRTLAEAATPVPNRKARRQKN